MSTYPEKHALYLRMVLGKVTKTQVIQEPSKPGATFNDLVKYAIEHINDIAEALDSRHPLLANRLLAPIQVKPLETTYRVIVSEIARGVANAYGRA